MKNTDLSTDALLNDLDSMFDDIKLLFRDYGVDLSSCEDDDECDIDGEVQEIALKFVELSKLIKDLL